MRRKTCSIVVVLLLTISPFISTISNAKIISGDEDVSQEDTSGGFVKIYGYKSFAQSFTPPIKGKIVSVSIYVGKKTFSYENSNNENNNVDSNKNSVNENNLRINSDNSILNKIRILGKSSLKDIISLLISKILGKNKKSEGYSS
ncbi:MAG: hypothetical protein H5T45_04700, partial [Thermoplasmatales archaeon]|nr:hypothetical protein [Thermoplasmatales archaeon]